MIVFDGSKQPLVKLCSPIFGPLNDKKDQHRNGGYHDHDGDQEFWPAWVLQWWQPGFTARVFFAEWILEHLYMDKCEKGRNIFNLLMKYISIVSNREDERTKITISYFYSKYFSSDFKLKFLRCFPTIRAIIDVLLMFRSSLEISLRTHSVLQIFSSRVCLFFLCSMLVLNWQSCYYLVVLHIISVVVQLYKWSRNLSVNQAKTDLVWILNFTICGVNLARVYWYMRRRHLVLPGCPNRAPAF